MSTRVITIGLVLLAGLVAGPAALADAKVTPSPSSTGPSSIDNGQSQGGTKAPNITFGVQPANPAGATPRIYFDMLVTKGTVNRDNVRVTNFSQSPLRLKVYAANAATALDGGFVVGGFTTHPTDFASWTQVAGLSADDFITLQARTRIDLPVFVTIPSTATPGDHGGAIVVSYFTVRRDAKGNTVNVENRVASRVYTRVAGPVRAGVTISQLTAHDDHGWLPWSKDRLTGSFVVRNTGTIRESVANLLTLSGIVHGRRTIALGGPGDILPGGSVRVTIPEQRIRPGIRTTVGIASTARQIPVGPTGPALVMSVDRASVAVWTIPWPTLLALVVLALAIGGAVLWWRRRAPKRPATGRRRTNGKPVSLDSLIDLTDRQPVSVPNSTPAPAPAPAPATAPTGQGVVRRLLAAAFVPAVLVLSLPSLVLGADPAQAAGHRLYFAPATGLDVTPGYVVTDTSCPAASSNVVGRAFGHGFPADGQPVINNSTAGVSHTAPFVLPLEDTMYAFARLNRTSLVGTYRITLTCADRLQQRPTTVFTGTMKFTSSRHYTAAAPPAAIVAAIQADQSNPGAFDSSPAIGSSASPSPSAGAQAGPTAGSSGSAASTPGQGQSLSPEAAGSGNVDLGRAKSASSNGPFTPAIAVLAGGAILLAALLMILDQRRKRLRATAAAASTSPDRTREPVAAQQKRER